MGLEGTETISQAGAKTLPLQRIFSTWWPLAASWLLMGLEGPSISAVMARLANPEINLAAYGGVVYPLSLIIEAPVIMLLAASVALSKDRASYQKIYRFMMITGAALTLLHILVAFTPLYYIVARSVLGVPEETIEPARLGLMIMTPWTWSIGFRRFQQGVLIRYGHSRAVGTGTIVRLVTLGGLLLLGYWIGGFQGIVVGTVAEAAAVVAEAIYAGWRVRPVLRDQLNLQPEGEPLHWRAFFDFYIPLALTSFLGLLWNTIGSAAISRMAQPLESLAVWPVLSGLAFMLRSPGMAYNEVVVALLGEPGASISLRRFTRLLSFYNTLLHLLIAATPLSIFWFYTISGLSLDLARMAQLGFWLALPIPLLVVYMSWFQGSIMYGKKTGGIPESVVLFLITAGIALGIGIARQWIGLYAAMGAYSLATLGQDLWLWFRSRPVMQQVKLRDREFSG